MKARNVERTLSRAFLMQMLSDEPLAGEILDIFHQKQANFLESWKDLPSPIVRLVKRKDGHKHVEKVLHFYDTAKPLLQNVWPSLLQAALHGGTARTLQVKTSLVIILYLQ